MDGWTYAAHPLCPLKDLWVYKTENGNIKEKYKSNN